MEQIEKNDLDDVVAEPLDLSEIEEEDVSSISSIAAGIVDDSVKLYLRDIGAIPLLSQEEELVLAKKIKEGILARNEKDSIDQNLEASIMLTDYLELEKKIEDGKRAKDKLVNANLRLVVSIAKHFKDTGMPFMDLIQEGSMGLMRAADKFDYETGYKFSTYATWWIRQSITRALADQSRTIRIPVHVTEEMRKIKKIYRELTNTLGREPTDEEMERHTDMSKEKIYQLLSYSNGTVSLDTKCGDDEDSVLSDFVADDSMKTPLQYTLEEKLKDEIEILLSKILTDREKMVMEMRFGLNNYPESTLEQVAQSGDIKVTRERIRQIEAKATRKLARSPEFRKLAEAYLFKNK